VVGVCRIGPKRYNRSWVWRSWEKKFVLETDRPRIYDLGKKNQSGSTTRSVFLSTSPQLVLPIRLCHLPSKNGSTAWSHSAESSIGSFQVPASRSGPPSSVMPLPDLKSRPSCPEWPSRLAPAQSSPTMAASDQSSVEKRFAWSFQHDANGFGPFSTSASPTISIPRASISPHDLERFAASTGFFPGIVEPRYVLSFFETVSTMANGSRRSPCHFDPREPSPQLTTRPPS